MYTYINIYTILNFKIYIYIYILYYIYYTIYILYYIYIYHTIHIYIYIPTLSLNFILDNLLRLNTMDMRESIPRYVHYMRVSIHGGIRD